MSHKKNWDNSDAVGPWLVPFKSAVQLDHARITTWANKEVRKDDTLNQMVYSVGEIMAYVSTFLALQAGDVIITATPTGLVPVLTSRGILAQEMR